MEVLYGDIKGTLYKLKNAKSYYYYFRHNSAVYRASTHTADESKARQYLQDLMHDVVHGEDKSRKSGKNRKQGETFASLFDRYVKMRQETYPKVSQTTVDNWLAVRPRILERFGDWTEDDFANYDNDQKLWLDYEKWRLAYYADKQHDRVSYIKNGNPVKGRYKNFNMCPCSMNKEISLVYQVLTWYKRNEDFLQSTTIPKFSMKDGVRKAEEPRIIFPTEAEYNKIKEYFENDKNDRIKLLFFRFLANCGARPSEGINATLDAIDYKNNVFWIRGRKAKFSRNLDTGFPMIGKFRSIIDEIVAETAPYRHKCDSKSSNLLFINSKGKPIGGMSYMHQCLKDAIKHKNIVNTKISLNSFRHMFVVKMVKQSSMPLYILAKMLGHSTTLMLQQAYAKYITHDAVQVMENVYAEIAEKRERYRQNGLE